MYQSGVTLAVVHISYAEQLAIPNTLLERIIEKQLKEELCKAIKETPLGEGVLPNYSSALSEIDDSLKYELEIAHMRAENYKKLLNIVKKYDFRYYDPVINAEQRLIDLF
jgi:predicted nucleic acid-binding protein